MYNISCKEYGVKVILIGLVELSAPSDNLILEGGLGAFVNALAYVENEEEFLVIVSDELSQRGLNLERIIWSQPIESRLKEYGIEEYLLDLARNVNEREICKLGKFHVWESE
jgi:hypothetical protein